jgi:hypothetical protein
VEDEQVAAAAYYFISARCVVGSLVLPRVGTRASFDAEQKNWHQTHRRSREGEVAQRMFGDVWR